LCKVKKKNESPKRGTDRIIRRLIHNRKRSTEREYAKGVVDLSHGLIIRDVRRFVYQYAVRYKLIFPQKRRETETSGTDWLNAFLKRNSPLVIRHPEITSLARAMNLNRANINNCFLRMFLQF
jgi:hypothetical protein